MARLLALAALATPVLRAADLPQYHVLEVESPYPAARKAIVATDPSRADFWPSELASELTGILYPGDVAAVLGGALTARLPAGGSPPVRALATDAAAEMIELEVLCAKGSGEERKLSFTLGPEHSVMLALPPVEPGKSSRLFIVSPRTLQGNAQPAADHAAFELKAYGADAIEPGKLTFQLKFFDGRPAVFLKLGESFRVGAALYTLVGFEKKTVPHPTLGKADASELTVVSSTTGESVVLSIAGGKGRQATKPPP